MWPEDNWISHNPGSWHQVRLNGSKHKKTTIRLNTPALIVLYTIQTLVNRQSSYLNHLRPSLADRREDVSRTRWKLALPQACACSILGYTNFNYGC